MLSPQAGFRSLPNVTFCCIANENDAAKENDTPPRYTQSTLHQMLQAMGSKPRHASKASARVFLILQQRAALPPSEHLSLAATLHCVRPGVSMVTLPRPDFERLVLESLPPHHHDPITAAAAAVPDLRIAAALQEGRSSVTILLCGTSGTGKSTLASLLAAKLGITTVISTDSIRHLLRSFTDPEEQPVLWASTYQAGAALNNQTTTSNPTTTTNDEQSGRRAAVQGYLLQAETVMSHVDRLIAASEAHNTSLVIEGVHLSPAFATQLMQQRPSVVPFLVHISNEAKHMERFAVRAKAMTLRPEKNRYVRHLDTIRDIQDHLGAVADRHAVPKVDNTNVDRSVATIHATVLGCLRRKSLGSSLIDEKSGRCTVVLEEYLRCKSSTWSGSDMLQLIKRKTAAGESVSPPTEGPSTSAASTSVAGGGGGVINSTGNGSGVVINYGGGNTTTTAAGNAGIGGGGGGDVLSYGSGDMATTTTTTTIGNGGGGGGVINYGGGDVTTTTTISDTGNGNGGGGGAPPTKGPHSVSGVVVGSEIVSLLPVTSAAAATTLTSSSSSSSFQKLAVRSGVVDAATAAAAAAAIAEDQRSFYGSASQSSHDDNDDDDDEHENEGQDSPNDSTAAEEATDRVLTKKKAVMIASPTSAEVSSESRRELQRTSMGCVGSVVEVEETDDGQSEVSRGGGGDG